MTHFAAVLLAAAVLSPALHADSKTQPVKPVFKEEQPQARKDARKAQLEIIAATLELRDRYSDFEEQEPRIAELAQEFLPGKNVKALTYLEGLYFIAKRAAAHEAKTDPAAASRD